MATKDEWSLFLEQEDSELFIISLIENIISKANHVLFEKQIDIQLLPYTVDYANRTLMDLINFNYYQRDPGNIDPSLWIPDEEPQPVTIDSWATGAVPVKAISTTFVRKETRPIATPRLEEATRIPRAAEEPSAKMAKKAAKPSSESPSTIPDASAAEGDRFITEENKRILGRIEDGKAADFTFDHSGKIIAVSTAASWNPIQEYESAR
ncbi:hypothetical protein HDU91_001441 [Kappamyces sp. JEL0680]|nr:hypothetical protein HDU91_001441 [Kappamyces sp. JEL0680]